MAGRAPVSGRHIAALAIVACLGAAGAAAMVIAQEREVAAAEAALERESFLVAQGETPAPRGAIDRAAPPRAVLLDAMRVAGAASTTADPARRRAMLDDAAAALVGVEAIRPRWAEAATARAYVHTLRDGVTAPAARDALARSYAAAPFLRHAAMWRIAAGLANWDAEDEPTRKAIVDEAVWISRSSAEAHEAVLALVRGSPAYARFFLRWRELRISDPAVG